MALIVVTQMTSGSDDEWLLRANHSLIRLYRRFVVRTMRLSWVLTQDLRTLKNPTRSRFLFYPDFRRSTSLLSARGVMVTQWFGDLKVTPTDHWCLFVVFVWFSIAWCSVVWSSDSDVRSHGLCQVSRAVTVSTVNSNEFERTQEHRSTSLLRTFETGGHTLATRSKSESDLDPQAKVCLFSINFKIIYIRQFAFQSAHDASFCVRTKNSSRLSKILPSLCRTLTKVFYLLLLYTAQTSNGH